MSLTKNDIQLIKELLDESNKVLRSDIAQFKDDILTEIVALRDDVTVVTGYRDQIEDHEDRLTSVEMKLCGSS